MDKTLLARILQEAKIDLTTEQTKMFDLFKNELSEWNKKINLTSIEDDAEIIVKHFYDSILGMKAACWTGTGKLLDLGTGAGFPGIPLKIICPQLNVTLVDSLKKRICFLEHIIKTLQLEATEAIHGRAEDLGQDRGYREKYDYVVSRAVAKMPVLLEFCLPFLKKGGCFIAYKGPEGEGEINVSRKALEILGGKINEIKEYKLPLERGTRVIITIAKENTTPSQYPRRPGTPEKRPL